LRFLPMVVLRDSDLWTISSCGWKFLWLWLGMGIFRGQAAGVAARRRTNKFNVLRLHFKILQRTKLESQLQLINSSSEVVRAMFTTFCEICRVGTDNRYVTFCFHISRKSTQIRSPSPFSYASRDHIDVSKFEVHEEAFKG